MISRWGFQLVVASLLAVPGLANSTTANDSCQEALTLNASRFAPFNAEFAQVLTRNMGRKIDPRILRVAAAEYLGRYQPSENRGKPARIAQDFASAIVKDRWTLSQRESARNFEAFVRSMIQTSHTLNRPFALDANEDARIPTHIMASLSLLPPTVVSPNEEPARVGLMRRLWNRLLSRASKTASTEREPVVAPLSYRFTDSEDLRRQLEGVATESVAAIISQIMQSKDAPLLTHLEALRILAAVPKEASSTIERIKSRTFTSPDMFAFKDLCGILSMFKSPEIQQAALDEFILADSSFVIRDLSLFEFADLIGDLSEGTQRQLAQRVQFAELTVAEINDVTDGRPGLVQVAWFQEMVIQSLSRSQLSWSERRPVALRVLQLLPQERRTDVYQQLVGSVGDAALDVIVNEALDGNPINAIETDVLRKGLPRWRAGDPYFARRATLKKLISMTSLGLNDSILQGAPTYQDLLEHRDHFAELSAREVTAFVKIILEAQHVDWFERMNVLTDLRDQVGNLPTIQMASLPFPNLITAEIVLAELPDRLAKKLLAVEGPVYATLIAKSSLPYSERREALQSIVAASESAVPIFQAFFQNLNIDNVTLTDVEPFLNAPVNPHENIVFLRVIAQGSADWLQAVSTADVVLQALPLAQRANAQKSLLEALTSRLVPSIEAIDQRLTKETGIASPEASVYLAYLLREPRLSLLEKVVKFRSLSAFVETSERAYYENELLQAMGKESLSLSEVTAAIESSQGMSSAFQDGLRLLLISSQGAWQNRRQVFMEQLESLSDSDRSRLLSQFTSLIAKHLDVAEALEFLRTSPQLSLSEATAYLPVLAKNVASELEGLDRLHALLPTVSGEHQIVLRNKMAHEIDLQLGPIGRMLIALQAKLQQGHVVAAIAELLKADSKVLAEASVNQAATLLSMIPTDLRIPPEAVSPKNPQRILIALRDRGRELTGKEWTATDLMVMGVDANIAVVYRTLRSLRSYPNTERHFALQLRDRVVQILRQSNLHDMTEEDLRRTHELGRKVKSLAGERHLTVQRLEQIILGEFDSTFGIAR